MLKPAALGFRAHSGWAALVALTGTAAAPVVILRRRLTIADPEISGSKQPFHAAEPMEFAHAESYIRRCADSTRRLTEAAVRDAIAEISAMGLSVTGSSVLMGSGRPMPDLVKILSAHPLIHTAEGEFFRDALQHACQSCKLKFSGVKERELLDHAADVLHIPPTEVACRAAELGKGIGPPWTQDQKLSAIAAWLVLADQH